MHSSLCTISFTLKKQKKYRDGYPIYARIIYNRKKSEIATGEFCPIEKWDEQHSRTKNDNRTNEHLHFIKDEIIKCKRELEQEHMFVTASCIKEAYVKQETDEIKLTDYFQQHIDKISLLKAEYKPGTVRHYKTTLKHVKTFLKYKRQTEISISEFDGVMVNDFDFYLMTNNNVVLNKALNRNTTNKYHTKLKSVLIKAIQQGILEKNPYNGFVLKRQKPRRTFLTQSEVKILREHSLGNNKSLDRVRDIYLFSVYTGLRFKDAIHLNIGDISKDIEGNLWINIIQEKTGEPLSIPMLKPAVEIYKKYEDIQNVTGRILPKYSNQKINSYLKTITEIAGIRKNLTHHTARHTFATSITLSNDVPLEVVSKMLGHTSIKSTQIYATIESQYLSKIARHLDEKL